MSNEKTTLTSNSAAEEKGLGGLAFFPFLILIGIVVARIIYNIAVGVPQQGNSFSIVAVTMVASAASMFIGRGKVMDRVDAFTKGAADPTAMMMVVIMLFSGIFTTVSSAMGGIASLTNFLLHFIPSNMIYVGILLVSSIVSLSIGSSVGTVTAMAPIAAGLASQADLNLVLAVSAVLGGASLGDNLSLISDTTIAATRSLGVEMRDKFKFNVSLVIPAFLISAVVYAICGISGAGGAPEIGAFNVIKMLPYFYILIAAILGVNMMVVLSSGILFSAVIGFAFGDLTIITFMDSVAGGMTKMTNTIFTAILVKGIMGVVEYNGGIRWLINKLTGNVKSAKGAQYSVAALTFCLGALIRSTSAIIVAGPLAKDICEPYQVDPRRTASILDIFATAQNGFVFWAGLTVDCASLVGGFQPIDLVFFAIYPTAIILVTLLSIQFNIFNKKRKAGVAAAKG